MPTTLAARRALALDRTCAVCTESSCAARGLGHGAMASSVPARRQEKGRGHLLDMDAPRRVVKDPEKDARDLARVQRWVMSVLAVTTIIHLVVGLVVAAVMLDDAPDSSQDRAHRHRRHLRRHRRRDRPRHPRQADPLALAAARRRPDRDRPVAGLRLTRRRLRARAPASVDEVRPAHALRVVEGALVRRRRPPRTPRRRPPSGRAPPAPSARAATATPRSCSSRWSRARLLCSISAASPISSRARSRVDLGPRGGRRVGRCEERIEDAGRDGDHGRSSRSPAARAATAISRRGCQGS